MTKENRERAYAHHRDLEKNYEAREGMNSGPTATSYVRARAKKNADDILKKHPELEAPKEVAKVEEPEPSDSKPKDKSKKATGKA